MSDRPRAGRVAALFLALGAATPAPAAGPAAVRKDLPPRVAPGAPAADRSPSVPGTRFARIGQAVARAPDPTPTPPGLAGLAPLAPLTLDQKLQVAQGLQLTAPSPATPFTLDAARLKHASGASLLFWNPFLVSPDGRDAAGRDMGPVATFHGQAGFDSSHVDDSRLYLTLTVPQGKRWMVDFMVELGDEYWLHSAQGVQTFAGNDLRHLVACVEGGRQGLILVGRKRNVPPASGYWALRAVEITPLN